MSVLDLTNEATQDCENESVRVTEREGRGTYADDDTEELSSTTRGSDGDNHEGTSGLVGLETRGIVLDQSDDVGSHDGNLFLRCQRPARRGEERRRT